VRHAIALSCVGLFPFWNWLRPCDPQGNILPYPTPCPLPWKPVASLFPEFSIMTGCLSSGDGGSLCLLWPNRLFGAVCALGRLSPCRHRPTCTQQRRRTCLRARTLPALAGRPAIAAYSRAAAAAAPACLSLS